MQPGVLRIGERKVVSENPNPLPESRCPTCGYTMDAALPLAKDSRGQPRPQDVTICLSCGEALCYNSALKLELAGLTGLMKLTAAQRHELGAAQALIREKRPVQTGMCYDGARSQILPKDSK